MNVQTPIWASECSPVPRTAGSDVAREVIVEALERSGLTQQLHRRQVECLADLVVIRDLDVGTVSDAMLEDETQDGLMILLDGDVEIEAMIEGESLSLHLTECGDVGRTASFAGGSSLQIRTHLTVRRESRVLLLQRSRLERLLDTQPALVYGVLRNLVLHVHGIARRSHADGKQLRHYVYGAPAYS
ncbi:putative transcriptional regulator, Crp/Fnr family [Burkholderiales bacterium GJ-E10]|nr:putative transcriptional regulator, Crp/Fnr family [Burkholderiales bacterium GJ-E10]